MRLDLCKTTGEIFVGPTANSFLNFPYRTIAENLDIWSDTDFAGCKEQRKSTSGGVLMLGRHCLKSWSRTQGVIALSSGEAEYYGMVKGGSEALGMRALACDLGMSLSIELCSDASAAIGIASRRGVGKVRHIEVSQLWLQQRVANGDIVLRKVDGVSNIADALTKYVGKDPIQQHMIGVGLELREGRHSIMPEIDKTQDAEFCDPECNSVNCEKGLGPLWLNEKREKRVRWSDVNPLEE